MGYELEGGQIARRNSHSTAREFGILRHPRPYVFSNQSHKVVEYYVYDVKESRIAVIEGHNLTRARGEDAAE